MNYNSLIENLEKKLYHLDDKKEEMKKRRFKNKDVQDLIIETINAKIYRTEIVYNKVSKKWCELQRS